MIGERVYRALLLLYPRRFRRDYRDEMVQLFQDQRRDAGSMRVWFRTVRDLLLTVPVRHQEAFMSMSPQAKLVAAAIAVVAWIALFATVGGGVSTLGLLVLLVWILVSLLRSRGAAPSNSRTWWKLAASGGGLFVAAFVFFAGPWPEEWREAVPGDLAWTGGAFLFTISLVMLAVGLISGLLQWSERRRLTP
jgi:hypothetical protein